MFNLKNDKLLGYTIVGFEVGKYTYNGTISVMAYCNGEYGAEPFGSITVNIEDSDTCVNDCNFIDSNNMSADVLLFLEENNIAHPTGRVGNSGYCVYPEYRFNKEFIREYSRKSTNG